MGEMDKKDMELNKRLMMEVGFDVGDHRRLIDQDTGLEVKFDGKYLVAPGSKSGKNSIEFDPINDVHQMSSVFSYYNQKVASEDGEEVRTYFPVETDPKTNKGYIEARTDTKVYRSNEYNNDSLKFTDIIMKMNGANKVDLSEYDRSKEELALKRKEKREEERRIYGYGTKGKKHKDSSGGGF